MFVEFLAQASLSARNSEAVAIPCCHAASFRKMAEGGSKISSSDTCYTYFFTVVYLKLYLILEDILYRPFPIFCIFLLRFYYELLPKWKLFSLVLGCIFYWGRLLDMYLLWRQKLILLL